MSNRVELRHGAKKKKKKKKERSCCVSAMPAVARAMLVLGLTIARVHPLFSST